MSFTAKIGQITGTPAKNDTNTIAIALLNAQHEIIGTISQVNPNMLNAMSSEVEATGASDTDLQTGVNSLILNVTRHDSTNNKTRNCIPIDMKFKNVVTDVDSLYFAPKTSPAYTFDKGAVEVFPTPTATESAKITKVIPGAVNDSAETVVNMPDSLKNLLVLIASREVIIQRLGSFSATLPTDLDSDTTVFDAIADFNDSIGVTTTLPSIHADYQDAVDKAQALIDDVAGIGGDVNVDGSGTDIYSAQKWLVDEDPEMLGGTLQTAGQELQRAQAVLAGHSAELNKYQAEISKESAEAGQALQEYQANLAKKIQLFGTIISKLNTDYQWLTGQLQLVVGRIQEAWSLISTPELDSQRKNLGGGIGK